MAGMLAAVAAAAAAAAAVAAAAAATAAAATAATAAHTAAAAAATATAVVATAVAATAVAATANTATAAATSNRRQRHVINRYTPHRPEESNSSHAFPHRPFSEGTSNITIGLYSFDRPFSYRSNCHDPWFYHRVKAWRQ